MDQLGDWTISTGYNWVASGYENVFGRLAKMLAGKCMV
jgi:hypothetical protein